MSDFERRADELLLAIEREHRTRSALLRSTRLVSLEQFALGDPIFITLGVNIEEGHTTSVGQLAGRLVDPKSAHIDVTDTDIEPFRNLDRIGLAVNTGGKRPEGKTYLNRIAGDNQFIFYSPKDIIRDQTSGDLILPRGKLKCTDINYGSVVVNNTALFDFITTSEPAV